MRDEFNYQSIYVNNQGEVFVDGATLTEDEGYVRFADGFRDGWGSYIRVDEARRILNQKLQVGDKRQVKALRAYQVISIQEELNNHNFSILKPHSL